MLKIVTVIQNKHVIRFQVFYLNVFRYSADFQKHNFYLQTSYLGSFTANGVACENYKNSKKKKKHIGRKLSRYSKKVMNGSYNALILFLVRSNS
jgi:hypothetical protein